MFSKSRNDRLCRIGDRMAADRLRDRNNIIPQNGFLRHNSAEIGDDAAQIIDIAANVIPC